MLSSYRSTGFNLYSPTTPRSTDAAGTGTTLVSAAPITLAARRAMSTRRQGRHALHACMVKANVTTSYEEEGAEEEEEEEWRHPE